jgi:class 3 adenylate cyclase
VAIRDDSAARGIGLRAGIHTGEVDIVADDINGISVHIADRITSLAQPGQILTSRTVKDLLTGSGIAFAEVGAYELAEIGDQWPVYEVTGA